MSTQHVGMMFIACCCIAFTVHTFVALWLKTINTSSRYTLLLAVCAEIVPHISHNMSCIA